LGVPQDELKDIREHLRAFSSMNENSVSLHETTTAAAAAAVMDASPAGTTTPQESMDPGVAMIMTLNNPKARNALTGKMMAELADCIDVLEKPSNHEALTAVILRGTDGFFCAGADIAVAKDHLLTPDGGRLMSILMTETLTRLRKLPVITVAAVEGMAIGGGAELTTACDYRVVNPDVTLRFVHAHMGVSPGWGGATRLTRLVGRQRALQLLGTAMPLNASQALDFGLVDHIVQAGSTMEKTLIDFLDRYTHAHPGVLHAAKRVVAGADDAASFQEAARHEHAVFCSMWGGEANQAAFKKAAQKKPKK